MAEQVGQEKAVVLQKYQGVTSLTRNQATEIAKTIWPKAPALEISKAALLCASYGLNPLSGHVHLIKFRAKDGDTWALVMGIKATRLIASRRARYTYADGPRRMTEREQSEIFGEVYSDRLYAITILQDEHGNKAPGYGFWLKKDTPYGTEKGNSALNMAMIRSERQAFERLIPGDMPAGVDVLDERFIIEGDYREVEEVKEEATVEDPPVETVLNIPPSGPPPEPESQALQSEDPPLMSRETFLKYTNVMGFPEDRIAGALRLKEGQKWADTWEKALDLLQGYITMAPGETWRDLKIEE